MKNINEFKSRDQEIKDLKKEEKIDKIKIIFILIFLVLLVILVIIIKRNIEIAEQKIPSLITISTEKKDAYGKKSEITIDYTIIPDHIDSTNLTWHSSNKEVAKFENNNILKTLNLGQTIIHAELSGIKSNELNIVVANFLEDVSIDNLPKQMEVGKAVDLNIELLPADSINSTVKIESSDDKIISVRDKTITAQNPGEVTLIIKDNLNNILRNYEIQVIPTITIPKNP